ncbi:wall-associated receptor kinase 2-like [Arachis stenosperma]|uniref:wall-associated receptor kinase 2-like n=1 Tax=Arachis stenosperma TaxID=217475 RepID=UPI0025AC5841|nr:wall-associated receptor kinase 2-like [Arachis stenosperma]
MTLKATLVLLLIVVALVLLATPTPTIAADDGNNQTLEGCRSDCGGVRVPYPFGIGNSSSVPHKSCFLQSSFNLACPNSTLYWGNIEVLDINISQAKVDMSIPISSICRDGRNNYTGVSINTPSFTISSEDNKFISVGCDTYGYLYSSYKEDNTTYATGCLTRCYGSSREVEDGHCSGIGCCQVDIPPKMKMTFVKSFSFYNFNQTLSFNNCSYSFVVKKENYTFYKEHLKKLPFDEFPVVFDWSVGNKETCEDSRKRGTSYACKGNTTCNDSVPTGYGYICQCNKGFQGNPYHPLGCTDIDECKTGQHSCVSDHNCHNTNGSYICVCPKGQSGKGTKEDGCQKKNFLLHIVIGASAGFIAILVGTCLLYLTYQKRKLIKLKEKFFEQNGGLILLQQGEESSHTKIFTADKLKKATNNYDENLIIGRGGYGTVFKGVLENKTIVAIKKSKIVDPDQVVQFINEVIVLSQINHRNVVKLLGCCLETEVPMLVYEFISNGTLFDFIHNENKRNYFNWENRLRIATETAGALSYLHSAASIPIVHRDVKSANILLDEDYTAKVSDFGASRFVPLDQTALATMVQGTFGYLDPEYMQTSQLTEKSDVYSFGVVLAELLTGKKPFSFEKSEEKTNLAKYFLSCVKEDCLLEALQVGILNEENKQEIVEVAIIATKCLRLTGEERPSMKEVAMELEGIRLMSKHHWVNNNGDKNFEETQHLLPISSSSERYEHGNSSSGQQTTEYDSIIKDQEVLIALPSGR